MNTLAIERIEQAINNLKENDFTLYFFIIDSKNTPNSSISYSYEMAKTLSDKGYNVKMLYQLENEYTEGELYRLKKKDEPIDYSRIFTGVGEWMGQEYANLPHMNIATEEWKVSPSDFLFIPEVFSGLMFETYKHKIPCKRYVILQNYNYVTEFIPLGVEWKNYGIYDAITISDKQAELIKNVFPYIRTHTITPYISNAFRKPLKPKKLIVNVVAKDQKDINRIIKPFYWKYPMYKFISFRDLRNFSRDTFAEFLQEGIITIWVDRETSFGNSPLEAMKCENIVIGKVPEIIPEWMVDENGLLDNGLWVYDINEIPDILAKVVASWMTDEIPEKISEDMIKTVDKYTFEKWSNSIDTTFKNIISEQIDNFNEVKKTILNEK